VTPVKPKAPGFEAATVETWPGTIRGACESFCDLGWSRSASWPGSGRISFWPIVALGPWAAAAAPTRPRTRTAIEIAISDEGRLDETSQHDHRGHGLGLILAMNLLRADGGRVMTG